MDLILEPRMIAWLPNLFLGAVSGLALAVMGYLGWYDRWWWYDNLAHLLGGVMLASPVLLFLPDTGAIVVVLFIAIWWEQFEFGHGVFPWTDKTNLERAWEDTLLDIAMVISGAVIAVGAL